MVAGWKSCHQLEKYRWHSVRTAVHTPHVLCHRELPVTRMGPFRVETQCAQRPREVCELVHLSSLIFRALMVASTDVVLFPRSHGVSSFAASRVNSDRISVKRQMLTLSLFGFFLPPSFHSCFPRPFPLPSPVTPFLSPSSLLSSPFLSVSRRNSNVR